MAMRGSAPPPNPPHKGQGIGLRLDELGLPCGDGWGRGALSSAAGAPDA